MANNRTCVICGSQYEYCPRCGKDTGKPTWMFAYCSQNCVDIFGIINRFNGKQISNTEAKIQLKNVDLSKLNNFAPGFKNSINSILDSVSDIKEENIENTDNAIEFNVDDIVAESSIESTENATDSTVSEPKIEKNYYKKNKRRFGNE